MQTEVFPNAPITEAMLDIRTNLPDEIDLAALANFQDPIRDRYPNRVDRVVWQSGFEVGRAGGVATHASRDTLGYQFTSDDGKKVAQARLDGFTHNKLKPYDRWESFFEEAKGLWGIYREIARPTNITRTAIRYINRIEVPMPVADMKDYLLTGPDIAPGAPQAMASYFMRLVLVKQHVDHVAIVTQATDQAPEDLRFIPIIFDIEVYLERVFEPGDTSVWTELEAMRAMRNEVFFSSVTDRCKELFR